MKPPKVTPEIRLKTQPSFSNRQAMCSRKLAWLSMSGGSLANTTITIIGTRMAPAAMP